MRVPRGSRLLVGGTLAVALAVLGAQPVRADMPDPAFVAVQAGVAAGHTHSTPSHGFHDPDCPFTELPGGGMLVGFDCGLGPFLDAEVVYATRALYRTPEGITVGPEHGAFPGAARSRVHRTIRLQAPAGFAVGGITLRTGLHVRGMALVYMKLAGPQLDTRVVEVSPWIGDRTGGALAFLGGTGELAVGLNGSQDETQVRSLGLVLLAPNATEPARHPDGPVRQGPRVRTAVVRWLPYGVLALVAGAAFAGSFACWPRREFRETAQAEERRSRTVPALPGVHETAVCATAPITSPRS